MTAPAVTIAPQATVGQAARVMRRDQVGRVPVTSRPSGRLAGIVTRSDLLRVYLRPGEEIRGEIEAGMLPKVRGVDPRRLAMTIRDGAVPISGRFECKCAIAGLVRGILQIEGVIRVGRCLAYGLDDSYPSMPASF